MKVDQGLKESINLARRKVSGICSHGKQNYLHVQKRRNQFIQKNILVVFSKLIMQNVVKLGKNFEF